ncbi:MAG TPA: retropepsin-like aspartic protease [Kofleriaceae bacterium]|jgi:hypothetical protein|nr:retropepsin-like aspartic protease [Kofleriaceae bacterium]
MKRLIGIAGLFVASSCTVGAPPGFSKGESWQFPLVGPLENGQLITTVWVNDKGPYLFLIDPDSPMSTIDDGVVSEVQPYAHAAADRYDDEQDTSHPMQIAEGTHLKIGNDLTVDHHDLWVVHVGTFNVGGRQVRGVIGHDIIADSMIFGFDRDKGVAYLATRKGFVAPPNAQVVDYRALTNHLAITLLPVPRHLVTAQIGGKDQTLHVDLGGVQTQLREQRWKDAGLQTIASKDQLVDEAGTLRDVDHVGIASEIKLGNLAAHGVKIVPYDDRRWEREDIDGVLGLGFFQDDAVWVDQDAKKIYVTPRSPSTDAMTKARIDRWGSTVLSNCPHTACFDVSVVPPDPNATGPQPPVVHFQRDDAAKDLNIELVLQPMRADGSPMSAPLLVVSFPQGADTMTAQLDPSYADAQVKVVDASPFVRACPTPGKGCLYSLAQ